MPIWTGRRPPGQTRKRSKNCCPEWPRSGWTCSIWTMPIPAVIAAHPVESGQILRSIVRHCTSGNVLALGMESADPAVVSANNLNASAEQVMQAIELINQIGRERGPTGLPAVLPGLNFIIGLDGETKKTLQLDYDFLSSVLGRGLLVRRINIRQVIGIRRAFDQGVSHSEFVKFKQKVRETIDRPMLERVAPLGTVLRRVYTEMNEGKTTFGRQIGTYPLLVGFFLSYRTGQVRRRGGERSRLPEPDGRGAPAPDQQMFARGDSLAPLRRQEAGGEHPRPSSLPVQGGIHRLDGRSARWGRPWRRCWTSQFDSTTVRLH